MNDLMFFFTGITVVVAIVAYMTLKEDEAEKKKRANLEQSSS